MASSLPGSTPRSIGGGPVLTSQPCTPLATQWPLPVGTMLQIDSVSSAPLTLGRSISANVAPPSLDAYRPMSVPASTWLPLTASARTAPTPTAKPPGSGRSGSATGVPHVLPPSMLFRIVLPEPSTKSPLPRYSVSGFAASIASAPTARLGKVSVAGDQVGPDADRKLNVFHTPPPDTAT